MSKTTLQLLLDSYRGNLPAQSFIRLVAHSNQNVFLSGYAGTGKTTLAQKIRQHISKKSLLFSPSEAIALQIDGQSLFHFFGMQDAVYISGQGPLPNLSSEKLKMLQDNPLIFIEEINQLRCDHMQLLDDLLRHNLDNEQPFGGLQLVLIGDLYQIPPSLDTLDKNQIQDLRNNYASRYFFGAKCFDQSMKWHLIELQTIYRQEASNFKDLLQAVRYNTLDEMQLHELNKRCMQDNSLYPLPKLSLFSFAEEAYKYNIEALDQLEEPQLNFKAAIAGIQLDKTVYPADYILSLKIGAQVVFVEDDTQQQWQKGTLGTVYNIFENQLEIAIGQAKNPTIVSVSKKEWPVKSYKLDNSSGKTQLQTVGTFSQFPLRLGWAMSVKQSQGFGFEQIEIKLGRRTFAAGETYAALSRCKQLKGLYLSRPFERADIFADKRIARFIEAAIHKDQLDSNMSYGQQNSIIEALESKIFRHDEQQGQIGHNLAEQAKKIEWQQADIKAAQTNLKALEKKLAEALNKTADAEKNMEAAEKSKVQLQFLLFFMCIVILCIILS